MSYDKTIYETSILDKEEKEYLENVIRPFRNKVKSIKKHLGTGNNEYIVIWIPNDAIIFPNFPKGTMYKGMELDKEYTLEELGLDNGGKY